MIQVVSDVVCPCCFIGKRRLEEALALLGRPDAAVEWKPFELNPDAPREGMDRQSVAAAGAGEGIEFRFDRITRIPNTFEAQRLIWLAGRAGVQNAAVESLFRAYFMDAEDVGDIGVLKRIGSESGLETDRLEELFTARLGEVELHSEELSTTER